MKKPCTIEEWNALAAKLRGKQPTKMSVVKHRFSKKALKPTTRSLPLHVVIKTKKGKNKKTIYFMNMLWKKRGTRVYEEIKCMCCDNYFSEGWRYIADESRVYLCYKCKSKIKPHFTQILYTPMK